jgi:hypothetical protein
MMTLEYRRQQRCRQGVANASKGGLVHIGNDQMNSNILNEMPFEGGISMQG